MSCVIIKSTLLKYDNMSYQGEPHFMTTSTIFLMQIFTTLYLQLLSCPSDIIFVQLNMHFSIYSFVFRKMKTVQYSVSISVD